MRLAIVRGRNSRTGVRRGAACGGPRTRAVRQGARQVRRAHVDAASTRIKAPSRSIMAQRTARSAGFSALVGQWEAAGLAARWPVAGRDAWIGVPTMNAPLKAYGAACHSLVDPCHGADVALRVGRYTARPGASRLSMPPSSPSRRTGRSASVAARFPGRAAMAIRSAPYGRRFSFSRGRSALRPI